MDKVLKDKQIVEVDKILIETMLKMKVMQELGSNAQSKKKENAACNHNHKMSSSTPNLP